MASSCALRFAQIYAYNELMDAEPRDAVSGLLTLKKGSTFYSLQFATHGWMAGDMVQYLGSIYQAKDPEVEILKLLGYTMDVNRETPPRVTDHWVEVDLDQRILSTNSDFIRKAVYQEDPGPDDPYFKFSLSNVHELLDNQDFTVRFYR